MAVVAEIIWYKADFIPSCELVTTMKSSVFSLLVGDYFYVLN